MTDSVPELTCRNQHIFAEIVKNYLESGSPVGSGLIAAHPDIDLSSASATEIESFEVTFRYQHFLASDVNSGGEFAVEVSLSI